jgi:cobalt-zinc-cadmium efflux system membrane fusion protein
MKMLDKQVVLGSAVLAIIAGSGYWGWQKFHAPQAEATTEKTATHAVPDTLRFDADAPQLTFLQIKPVEAFPEPLAEPLNARIAYDDNYTARVFSSLAGRVVKIYAEAGQQVQVGDPLLLIDSPDYASAASDSMKADADLLRKKEAFDRAKSLFEVQGMARKDLESAATDWQQAEAEAQRTKARMRNLNGTVSDTAEGKFVLRAPVKGVVSERQVNAGSEVRPDAANPLFVITNPQHLWVVVDLPEQQMGKVKVGQPVSVEVDAYPGKAFPGKIRVIGEILDPVTRRVQVRCEVDNRQYKLKPEMFAHVIPTADAKSSLPRVPNSALFTQGLYSFLFVEQSPDVLQRRRVTLAMQGADFTYVKEGLHAGERIVTTGALLLNSELSGND